MEGGPGSTGVSVGFGGILRAGQLWGLESPRITGDRGEWRYTKAPPCPLPTIP